jgi:cytochrome c oxidase cbb3-type subunit 3
MKSRAALMVFILATTFGGCEREARRFSEPAEKSVPAGSHQLSDVQAGGAGVALPGGNSYEDNAYAVSQGQRLFTWYNCTGCHGHGGGGSGPALMDDKWIYGHEPANIYATIVQGRPNGMPAFGGKITEAQVWQLVAYVRAMGGIVGGATATSRPDHMKAAVPEAARDPQTPRASGTNP